MSANRIKGQEVSVQLTVNGQTQNGLDNIRDLDITFKLNKTQEGYLGDTTDQYDEIFNGVDGKISMHTSDEGVLEFIDALVQRAQRRTPGTKINLRASLRYPNGQRPRIIFPDCYFSDVPFSFASRQAYGLLTLSWSCSQPQRIG